MSSSSLISFVALEEALRSLEARLSQRDAEVAELRSAVAAAASKDDVNALVTPIRASLDNLAERVDALERAVFIDTAALRREATSVGGSGASLGSGAVTLGEVVSALHKGAVASMRQVRNERKTTRSPCRRCLTCIASQLDDMATREELRRELARVEAEARSEREALDASKASASLVSRSEAVARTTREAVLALESVVCRGLACCTATFADESVFVVRWRQRSTKWNWRAWKAQCRLCMTFLTFNLVCPAISTD